MNGEKLYGHSGQDKMTTIKETRDVQLCLKCGTRTRLVNTEDQPYCFKHNDNRKNTRALSNQTWQKSVKGVEATRRSALNYYYRQKATKEEFKALAKLADVV